MNSVWLTLLAAAEVAEGAPTSPFDVNFGLFVWTWLVFGALFLVLKKYAWPAILSATEAREQKIAAHLAETERLNLEARAAAETATKAAADARASAQALLTEARSSAEKERAGLLEKTKLEQDEILARARREIVAEKERALVEIRREAVDLSLAAAARLIEQRFDSDSDRKLVNEYLDSIRNVH